MTTFTAITERSVSSASTHIVPMPSRTVTAATASGSVAARMLPKMRTSATRVTGKTISSAVKTSVSLCSVSSCSNMA